LRRRKSLLIGLLLIVVLIGFTGSYLSLQAGEQHFKEEKIGVVATMQPLAEFAEKVGGDHVQVSVMIPPGASPHTYEPTPSQIEKVGRAEIYVKAGSGVEFELASMNKLVELNREMLVIDCSKGIDLIEVKEYEEDASHHNGHDPHIWLSPKNAKIIVENIYKGLALKDPANQEYYLMNKEQYLSELDKLDRDVANTLSGKTNRKFMVYHPAWAYFAKDYGLEQISIEREGKEPTPQGIISLIEQAKMSNISVIFASPEFSIENAEVIAKEIDGEVVLISPFGSGYLENMYNITEAFAKAL